MKTLFLMALILVAAAPALANMILAPPPTVTATTRTVWTNNGALFTTAGARTVWTNNGAVNQ